jgi:rhomboid protease GluP
LTNESETPLRVTRDHNLAQEWELALLAEGLSPSMRWSSKGIVISVPAEQVERASAGLAAYEVENPRQQTERREPVGPSTLLAGTVVAAMLLAFFYITIAWKSTLPWFERGSADAERILDGEIWRAVTALTLHANLVHVISNAIGAAIFLGAVGGLLGPGIGSALVLLAGAGGNLTNALVHESAHVSIGASTSVFGAVGVLGGLGMARRRRGTVFGRRAWIPMAAAVALLGMLGTEGQRVDIWAHFLGLLVSFSVPHRHQPSLQWFSGGAAFALVIYCWSLALG